MNAKNDLICWQSFFQEQEAGSPGPMQCYQHYICAAGRIIAPKDVHLLLPGTCEYVNLCGRRGFADVIKLKILSWGDYPGLSQWAPSNHKGPYKRETGESEKQRSE